MKVSKLLKIINLHLGRILVFLLKIKDFKNKIQLKNILLQLNIIFQLFEEYLRTWEHTKNNSETSNSTFNLEKSIAESQTDSQISIITDSISFSIKLLEEQYLKELEKIYHNLLSENCRITYQNYLEVNSYLKYLTIGTYTNKDDYKRIINLLINNLNYIKVLPELKSKESLISSVILGLKFILDSEKIDIDTIKIYQTNLGIISESISKLEFFYSQVARGVEVNYDFNTKPLLKLVEDK